MARAPRSRARSSSATGMPSSSRAIDPELFFDFQMTRPHVSLVDGQRRLDWPENAFHHARVNGRRRRAARCGAARRHGAEPPLEGLQRPRDRRRDRARRDDGGYARLAPRRRSAHAALPGDRQRLRGRRAREPRAAALPLRRADGNGRRAPRCLPRAPDPVRLALGGRAPLRPAHPLAAGGEGALRPALDAPRASRSTPPSSRRPGTRTSSR